MEVLKKFTLIVVFLPLFSSILVRIFGKYFTDNIAGLISVFFMLFTTVFSFKIFYGFYNGSLYSLEIFLYTWAISGSFDMEIGFLMDKLTALMIFVVSFVSFMVHIYTIGYMKGDSGFKRFFSYISFFTFSMLMLVCSNNFLQLFFGWEAVGLASYLLIGFWFNRESAVFANLKAFIVNRVGDFGFLLGIAAIAYYFGTLNYIDVFSKINDFVYLDYKINFFGSFSCFALTFICICLFVGAMGKSAQIPLHVWLPDSMEGPTPISALIHAATMVTAGIFMTTRMSPLFEYSQAALGFILFTGSITCLFMGILGIVQNDIKRIVAYSTLSQLGLMVVGLGVSAYSVSIFHLMTHAFFKALLFLGAGSVIIGMHHEQNIKKMGGLFKNMPFTYITMLFGSLALIGFPGFSGFFSKDLIIETLRVSNIPFSNLSYYMVVFGVFITAFYTFRLFFIVFHNKINVSKFVVKESSITIVFPLVVLAIPSIFSGIFFINPLIDNYFENSIFIFSSNDTLTRYLESDFHGVWNMILHALSSVPFFLTIFGVFFAWIFYIVYPGLSKFFKFNLNSLYKFLVNKYGFDDFNQFILSAGVLVIGKCCWIIGDKWIIDGFFVNGTAKLISRFSSVMKYLQTGYLYHYIFFMVFGLLVLLVWLLIIN